MPTADYRPVVGDVAAKVLARTVDDDGNRLGTFTRETSPTAAQVAAFIDGALLRVAGRVGADLPDEHWPLARDVAATWAAMQVERSVEPESTSVEQSAYQQLRQEFIDGLQMLIDSVTTDPGDVQGVESMAILSPTLSAQAALERATELP